MNIKVEPCLYCGDNLKELVSGDAQCLGCGAIVEYCNIPLHNRLSRIVRAAEALSKVLPEKWQQDILIRWLDGYDHIKGTTSKEIQTVMGELFSKASALKDAVEGGAESLARIREKDAENARLSSLVEECRQHLLSMLCEGCSVKATRCGNYGLEDPVCPDVRMLRRIEEVLSNES